MGAAGRKFTLWLSTLLIAPGLVVLAASPAEAAGCTLADSHGVVMCTYDYTGGVQKFTVPLGISSITVDLYGASGGDDAHTDGRDDVAGGNGAHVTAKLAVSPDEVYDVVVGQEGIFDSTAVPSDDSGFSEPTQAAYNGGAPGTVTACTNSAQLGCDEGNVISAGGGGATDLRPENGNLGARLIVAGGGGGAAADFNFHGFGQQFTIKGWPGGDGDSDGQPADLGGKAGTDAAGGAGGTRTGSPYVFPGSAGTTGSGGIGGPASGGGGGGLWGGGGGAFAVSGFTVPGSEDEETPLAGQFEFGGGGGGSSFTGGTGVSEGTVADDVNDGNGKAVITYDVTPDFDLSITKTDGVTSVPAGAATTYTITASNAGPNTATDAKVADTFPAGFIVGTWSSVSFGGATGNTANGLGDINETVTMPAGSSITWTVAGTVSSSATGSLINTATITAPSGTEDTNTGNNSATDTDTITVPQADLSITKTDGVTSVAAGTSTTYTITVSNAGPQAASGVKVADTLPSDLTGVHWSSTSAGGALNNTASGTGNISDTVVLPPLASVTYTVTGTVKATATGSLANTATVTAPSGVTDPTEGNNSATDTDTITAPVDTDHDGLTDPEEEQTYHTDPQNPDSDGDGLKDGKEVDLRSRYQCLDPNAKDSDGDGLKDGREYKGSTIDQYVTYNGGVPGAKTLIGVVTSNPCKTDTDKDGLKDGKEVKGVTINQVVLRKPAHGGAYTIGLRKTNPRLADTDKDGLTDKQEVTGSAKPSKSDPTTGDTDWGNVLDGADLYPAIYGK